MLMDMSSSSSPSIMKGSEQPNSPSSEKRPTRIEYMPEEVSSGISTS